MAHWYLDHNVSQRLVPLLDVAPHSVTTAQQIGMEYASDEHHLLVAADRRYVLVTHNIKDFRLLQDAWLRWSRAWQITPTHAGIVLVPNRWEIRQGAEELHSLIAKNPSLTNELYEWTTRNSWIRRPPPT